MIIEYLLPVFYVLLCIFLIGRMSFFQVDGISRNAFRLIFGLKLAAGFILTWIYTNHYPIRVEADIFRFFDNGTLIFEVVTKNPWHYILLMTGFYSNPVHIDPSYVPVNFGSSDMIMIRFNALLNLFSFGFFHVHTVIICFLSLIGLTSIYKVLSPFIRQKRILLIIAIYGAPSVIFWCSGLLKESLAIFFLGMLLWSLMKMGGDQRSVRYLVMIVVFGILLYLLKVYLIVALIPAFAAFLISKNSSSFKVPVVYLGVFLIYLMLIFTVGNWIPQLDLLGSLAEKQAAFFTIVEETAPNHVIPLGHLEPQPLSFIKLIPQALANVFFRPHLLESDAPFLYIAAIENIGIIIWMIICLIMMNPKHLLGRWFFFCLIIVSFIFVLVGMETPILGAIVRYKVPAIPFLLAGSLLILKDNIKF